MTTEPTKGWSGARHHGGDGTFLNVREANKKRMAVDIARAINEPEAKRDAMKRGVTLRVVK